MSRSREKELLQDLCRKYSVNPAVVEELLRIEKEYRLRERRHGIYDRLQETVKASISGVRGDEA